MISVDTVLKRVERLPFARLDQELLALDAERGYVYCLNHAAGHVWDLFREPTSVAAACERLMRDFAVDDAACHRDVLAILNHLLEAGLVEIVDAPSIVGG